MSFVFSSLLGNLILMVCLGLGEGVGS